MTPPQDGGGPRGRISGMRDLKEDFSHLGDVLFPQASRSVALCKRGTESGVLAVYTFIFQFRM